MINKIIFLGIFSIFAIMLIPASDAVLWDLIIQTNVEYSTSLSGTPIISGIVTDHASHPVKDVTVSIRTGDGSTITYTDEEGKFSLELTDSKRITGNYIVNIVASTADGKTGITSTEFQVFGEFTKTSIIEEKLSTPEAVKYLSANPSQFEKDPIGFILYNHYQKLLQEYFDIENQKVPGYQRYFQEQNEINNPPTEQTINSFSGTYEEYMNSMKPSIRNIVENQLNLTIKIFDEAKQIKNSILENGGTDEEANLAYLEYISISKESLENFGVNSDDLQKSKITSNGGDIIIQSNISGVKIKVGGDGTVFSVSVDKIITEFVINENNNIQIINLEN